MKKEKKMTSEKTEKRRDPDTGEKDTEKKALRPVFLICLGLVIFLLLLSWPEIRPRLVRVFGPEHEFLALQPEEGSAATQEAAGNYPYMGRMLVSFYYIASGGDRKLEALIVFDDGRIYSGECAKDKSVLVLDSHAASLKEEGAPVKNYLSDWTYRGKLYESDLQILIEEQEKAWTEYENYDWLRDPGDQPNASPGSYGSGGRGSYQIIYYASAIKGEQYKAKEILHAAPSEIYQLAYDKHSWFVIQSIRESGFYQEWMEECFGTDWKQAEEVKDTPDRILESWMKKFNRYCENREEYDREEQRRLAEEEKEACKTAAAYYYEKYGEKLELQGAEETFENVNLKYLTKAGMCVYAKDGIQVMVDKSGGCRDNRQYAEILHDFKEYYLSDTDTLFGPAVSCDVSLNFKDIFYPDYSDNCVADYYNGNIIEFLNGQSVNIMIKACYYGEPSKREAYGQRIKEKLYAIKENCRKMSADIRIKDKEKDRPEIPEVFQMIALGIYSPQYVDESKNYSFFDPHYPVTDAYTSVYSATSHEKLGLASVDVSDGLEARSKNSGGEKVYRIRPTAYCLEQKTAQMLYLRFDRKHYDISDDTVPLLVSSVITEDTSGSYTDDWIGYRDCEEAATGEIAYDQYRRRLYYYMDEDYLYLYSGWVGIFDGMDTYIAFTQD